MQVIKILNQVNFAEDKCVNDTAEINVRRSPPWPLHCFQRKKKKVI